MLKIGLTGGIGCGKSTAVKRFRELGIPVIEADLISREVVAGGQPALQEIASTFGTQALLDDGTLNRPWLRQTVFGDAVRLAQLEAILHPRIKQAILHGIASCHNAPYVIVDIPLLLEKGYKGLFDRILIIDCLPSQQLQRVKLRDGSDESLIQSIMQTQIVREQRLREADDILENQGSIAAFYKKVEELHDNYLMISRTRLP